MPDPQLYEALHNAYQLCALLFRKGVTVETLPYIQAIEPLATALPAEFDADEAAAQHYGLFEELVFPYQSIFLDPSNLIGGNVADQLQSIYQLVGFVSTESADHIATELECLAWLCNAASSTEDVHLQKAQLLMLTELQSWVLPFAVAMKRSGSTFYQALADFMLLSVSSHPLFAETDRVTQLPDPPALLDDDNTRLGDIATYMLTPVQSGIYIASRTIQQLGRQFNLPIGFGTRNLMLTNVFRQAAHYDCVDDIWEALQASVQSWRADYADYPERLSAAWLAQAAKTLTLLEKAQAEAIALEDAAE